MHVQTLWMLTRAGNTAAAAVAAASGWGRSPRRALSRRGARAGRSIVCASSTTNTLTHTAAAAAARTRKRHLRRGGEGGEACVSVCLYE